MIKIYTRPNCIHCTEAKEYFNKNNIKYDEINLEIGGNKDTIEMKKEFKKMGIDKVPIIVIDDNNIMDEFDKDVLDEILRSNNNG